MVCVRICYNNSWRNATGKRGIKIIYRIGYTSPTSVLHLPIGFIQYYPPSDRDGTQVRFPHHRLCPAQATEPGVGTTNKSRLLQVDLLQARVFFMKHLQETPGALQMPIPEIISEITYREIVHGIFVSPFRQMIRRIASTEKI